MDIVLHAGVGDFARLARPLLDADPLRHTVLLTVLDGLVAAGEPAAAMLTVQDGGDVVGAALRVRGHPVLVSAIPPHHAAAVEAALADVDPALLGGIGPTPETEAFAAAHRARTGAAARVVMRMRLFALGTLVAPAGVPGSVRRATEEDLDLLAVWRRAFVAEALLGPADHGDPRESAARSLRLGSAEMLWETGGVAVAHARARRPVAGMSRIGPVYTLPEHRRRGYGAAVTAAATQWALDTGVESVVLFTDLANPTTNALYPRIGYRPVHDAVELRFGPRAVRP